MTFLTPLISLRDELLLFELNHFPCKVKLCQTKNELTKDGRNSRSSSEQASESILSLEPKIARAMKFLSIHYQVA